MATYLDINRGRISDTEWEGWMNDPSGSFHGPPVGRVKTPLPDGGASSKGGQTSALRTGLLLSDSVGA